jgi:hypothetical protein
MGFHITGDPKSDAVLDKYPFAILTGMMLDQHISGPCDSSVGRAGGAILPDLVRWMISRVRQLWAFDLATARPCA